MYYTVYEAPVGALLLESDGEALTGLRMNRPIPERRDSLAVFDRAEKWLDDYFAGRAGQPDFALKPEGTEFQKLIWNLLMEIPFGQTCSYGNLARKATQIPGREKMSPQAVGGAVGRNPISILIPCHRVIGADGALTGYAGGLDKKRWLLRHEGSLEGTK